MDILTLILIYYLIIPTVIAVIIGAFRLKQGTLGGVQTWLFILAVCSLVADVISRIMHTYGIPNLLVGNLYMMAECAILLQIYKKVRLTPSKTLDILLYIFLSLAFLNLFLGEGTDKFNVISRSAESILMTLLGVIFFSQMLQNTEIEELWTLPVFWANSAILLYFSANTFIFVFSQYILKYSVWLNLWIWTIHGFFLMLFFGFVSIALYLKETHFAQAIPNK